MAQYAVNNTLAGSQQNIGTTLGAATGTVLSIFAATGATTLRRGWVYEFEIGVDNVPNATDCPVSWDVSSQTADGTGTALTAQVIDQGGGDAAALLTYKGNYTAAPTVTAGSSVFYLGLNQRASQRWIARDQSSCLIIAAVNAKGWAFRAKSPNYASTVGWQAYVQE